MNGGHTVVAALQAVGVDAIFAIHGVQIDPIFQGCIDTGVRLVDVRHEASAGFAAEAYARTGRGLGVVAVCPGPGFTNVMTSIANASLDRTPVIYIVSSNPPTTFHSNGLQTGIDHVALAAPLTKWGGSVTDAAELPAAIARAIAEATTPPRGPVVLDIASDVLSGACLGPIGPAVGMQGLVAPRWQPVVAAERPALVVGERLSVGDGAAVRAFLALTGMPCFSNYGALGIVGDGDEHHGGSLFQLGRLALECRPDVIVMLDQALGFDTPGLRDGGASWGAQLVTVGSADLLADAASLDWPDRWAWRAAVRAALAATRAELDAIPAGSGGRLHPHAAARAATDAAFDGGAVVVGDGAVCKHWLHDALRVPEGGRYLTHGRLGCMGQGLGATIGAAVATGGPVVCVTGDGAMGFALGELEAIARHGLDGVVVVMNNARWGASMGFQLRHGGPDRTIGTALSDAAYHDAAIALGGAGERIDDLAALDRAMRSALASGGLTVLNVNTHSDGPPSPELPLLMSYP